MPIVFFKDKFIPEQEVNISINDRAFRFGDGIFETILVNKSQIFNLKNHYARLILGLRALYIDIDLNFDYLKTVSDKLLSENNITNGYLRIIVSRGENGPDSVGYITKNCKPYILIQTFEKELCKFKELNLWLSSSKAHSTFPAKTNNSLQYVLSMLEAHRHSCDNALILNSDNYICETASANIYWFKDEKLYSPSLELPLIPGTIQKIIFDICEEQLITEYFTIDDLVTADEVFMSNTGVIIAGIQRITNCDGVIYENKTNKFSKTLELRNKILRKHELL